MPETDAETEVLPSCRSSHDGREPVLYHYTNFVGLAGIASSKAVWCSQIQYLNDFGELRHGLEILTKVCAEDYPTQGVLSDITSRAQAFEKVNVFVCSFSEANNVLSQWRGYSGGGGVSVEFSFEKLSAKARSNQFSLTKCVYDYRDKIAITRKFIENQLSKCDTKSFSTAGIDRIVFDFLHVAARFKHPSFIEEQEWRLISPLVDSYESRMKVRSSIAGLIPYIEFDLKTGRQPLRSELQPWRTNEDICVTSVIVGPSREQELQMSAVGKLFDSNRAYVNGVGRSEIPFRML